MRFCGLALHDPVPDAKTIWLFREQLTRAGAHPAAVRALRCNPARARLPGDGRPDRRCHGHRGAPAAADRSREGDDQGRRRARGLDEGAHPADRPRRPLDAEARPETPGAAGRVRRRSGRRRPRSRCRCSATRTTSASTGRTASSAARPSPTPRPTTAASSKPCSIPTTRQARSGPIPPTARRPTWQCLADAGWCRGSSAGDADGPDDQAEAALFGGEHVLDLGPYPGPRRIAPANVRRHRLAARLRPPQRRSCSPTSPTTCAGLPGSRGKPRQPDARAARQPPASPPSHPTSQSQSFPQLRAKHEAA